MKMLGYLVSPDMADDLTGHYLAIKDFPVGQASVVCTDDFCIFHDWTPVF